MSKGDTAVNPRRIVCRDGQLVYAEDGAEVCLWGVNYYAAHFVQYDNIKRLGLDHKQVIDRDFADLKAIGCEVVRMHLFDREIADRAGHLVDNPHLDLIEYTIAACAREGMHFFLTAIAWWPAGAFDSADGFSNYFSQEALKFLPDALQAQETYLSELLQRPNRYRGGTPIGRDPTVALVEIMNEAEFGTYKETLDVAEGRAPALEDAGGKPGTHGTAVEKRAILAQFDAWLAEWNRPRSEAAYQDFVCDRHTAYCNRMTSVIRKHAPGVPVFMPYFCNWYVPNIAESLARCDVDGITFNTYLGGRDNFKPSSAAGLADMLSRIDYSPLTGKLRHKPKAVYEFGDGTTCTSVLPLMALRFREAGAQIATYFQYDSIATAPWNSDWAGEWLNRHHSPGRGVAFAVAREVFHATPLYADAGPRADIPNDPGQPPVLWRWGDIRPREQYVRNPVVFGPLSVDLSADCAVWNDDRKYLHSGAVPASLLAGAPARAPEFVLGVGSNPWHRTDGDGWFRVETQGPDVRVELGPKIVRLADPIGPEVGKDITKAQKITDIVPGARSLTFAGEPGP